MDASCTQRAILPTTPSASITLLFLRVFLVTKIFLSNAGLSDAKVFPKSTCKTRSPLSPAKSPPSHESQESRYAHLSRPGSFRSDQMIAEKEIRTGAGPRWDCIGALLDDRDPATDDRTIDVSPAPIGDDIPC
jgi:hypothetical protein